MKVYRLHTLTTVVRWIMAGALITGLLPGSRASAQGRPGSATFGIYCGSCHGTSAKGDGPLASQMKNRPADLTQTAKRNGGSFPTEQVARIIDGRSPVKGMAGKTCRSGAMSLRNQPPTRHLSIRQFSVW
jgi:mono/diheme cytochrome c family protein